MRMSDWSSDVCSSDLPNPPERPMTSPARILSQAGDGVRQFNHETISTGAGWQYPPHAYDAIGSLAYLVRMLPQAIEQTMRPVQRAHEQGRVTVDGGAAPKEAVAALRAAVAQIGRAHL